MSRPAASLPEVPDTLLAWAVLAGPAQLLAAARNALQAGSAGDRVQLRAPLDGRGRDEVGRLLGLDWAASGKPVTLGLLRKALARNHGDLIELLEARGGPLRDLRAEQAVRAQAREQRRLRARAVLVGAGAPEAVADLLLTRRWLGPADDDAFADRAAELGTLLRAVPLPARTLATAAQDLYGDPHALDRDRLLGRAAARAFAAIDACSRTSNDATPEQISAAVAAAADGCASAAGWRAAWATGGIICDQVSSTVLVLNLPVPADGPAGAVLAAAAAHGEPVWVTARMLRHPWHLPPGSLAGTVVRVCENPSVVETAADQLGPDCPPLVCTYGRPSTAAWAVLEALQDADAQFLVTADRDAAGESIAADLLRRLRRAAPWLPDVPGLYEEERQGPLIRDMADHARAR